MKTIKMIQEIPDGEIESLYLETEFSAFSKLPLREWGNVLNLHLDKVKNTMLLDFDLSNEDRKGAEFLISSLLNLDKYTIVIKVSEKVFCFKKV